MWQISMLGSASTERWFKMEVNGVVKRWELLTPKEVDLLINGCTNNRDVRGCLILNRGTGVVFRVIFYIKADGTERGLGQFLRI